VSTIIEKMQVLVDDKYGRHVLHYLLSARDPQCVNKEIRDFLSIGDANPFSKKDSDIRRKELRDEVLPFDFSCTIFKEVLAISHFFTSY